MFRGWFIPCRWTATATPPLIIPSVRSHRPATDLAKCRHKRIFNDPVGAKGAKNQKPSLFQTYVRDTGEILADLTMPIMINGRHWGGVRIGFKTDLVK